ncbi:MAG TPA: class I SAM-dependent methyltransferase [Candidatus Saccharimonadales bacterium]|nr:class I SAM-dependent methyltransferase [Candidatus Saccharimonadales bacterium]
MSSISPGDRRLEDCIPPENFPRVHLDRSIDAINTQFAAALGPENGPIQTSADLLRATGSITLMDWGCGTGNTLRTWSDTLRDRTAVRSDKVHLIGLSKYDYSGESLSPATERACRKGKIRYVVGDAFAVDASAYSADITLSYSAMMHVNNPVRWLDIMLSATKPGGYSFFELTMKQALKPEFSEHLDGLLEQGYEMQGGNLHFTQTKKGEPIMETYRSLFRLSVPLENVFSNL